MSGMIHCRYCAWAVPAGLRRKAGSKSRKPRDGWSRLADHIHDNHPDVAINYAALRTQRSCDDRLESDDPAPAPGDAPDAPSRRAL